jgi:hypothetical protein
MKLAAQLTNGDNNFAFAVVNMTPSYANWLLQMIDDAAELNGKGPAFRAIELWDKEAEFGSALGPVALSPTGIQDLATDQWEKVPDHQWPEGCQQDVLGETVIVTAFAIRWRALVADGQHYETVPLTANNLRKFLESV